MEITNTDLTPIQNPTRTGWEFVKWVDASGNEIGIDNVYDNNVFYADWTDTEAPTVTLQVTNNVAEEQTVTASMSDTGSGISKVYFGEENPDNTEVVFTEHTSNTYTNTVTKDGIYYFSCEDAFGNRVTKQLRFYKVDLVYEAGVTCPVRYIVGLDGNSLELPTPLKQDYSFEGWVNAASAKVQTVTFNSNQSYTATWIKNPYTLSIQGIQYDTINEYQICKGINNTQEDRFSETRFVEKHPNNTALHGTFTINGVNSLNQLLVKDGNQITIQFTAEEDYFLKDILYNGKEVAFTETYNEDGSSSGQATFTIDQTTMSQTLQIRFSPEWAYSTALASGYVTLGRYVGRNPILNVPSRFESKPVMLNMTGGSAYGPFGDNPTIQVINFPKGGLQAINHNYGYMFAVSRNLTTINNFIIDNAAVNYMGMFSGCNSLKAIPTLGGGASLTNTAYMCKDCKSITEFPIIGGIRGVPGNVSRIDMMFFNCPNIGGEFTVKNNNIEMVKCKGCFATNSNSYQNVICAGTTLTNLKWYKYDDPNPYGECFGVSQKFWWHHVNLNGVGAQSDDSNLPQLTMDDEGISDDKMLIEPETPEETETPDNNNTDESEENTGESSNTSNKEDITLEDKENKDKENEDTNNDEESTSDDVQDTEENIK